MSFVDFKGIVKKVNHKPKGITEVVLEVPTKEVGSGIQNLAEMIDKDVQAQLESEVVQFNVQVNAHTDRPIINYTVGSDGIVKVADPEPEQLEANLGLPEEKPKIEEKPKEIERKIVDSFITEDMAPILDGFPVYITEMAKRRIEGESYQRIANDYVMYEENLIDLINEYRKEVAPYAQAWWDWKQDQEAEAEPMEKQAPRVPLDEADNPEPSTEDEKEDENKDEDEHGAA
ncbi:hypothetical protein SJY89_19740 [Bacillus velezensis]|uniref:hypothetical protein n=1 Tax=Bacillus TaxID=1386 RepID=UPI00083D5717|nr:MULTISPECIES: hypothetical protein [Bacillus]AWM42728.1 hypothetical protein BAALB65_01070 [Bacillus amyloliquefaciens]MCE4941389.1 hypothetical protein [Bacillus velezensis]MDU0078121.1 hypothetical protein [Bacillus sp. IG2]MDU0103831.1 hypothetical protein [Bacillus sp. IS1]MDX7897406.1 hypothetical protein [Bacillus velezensis]